ncbi:MAG: ECF transporter S component [Chloroflexota bacterium]|nr:ECF transporter S component [Chloroflexota bacterium]
MAEKVVTRIEQAREQGLTFAIYGLTTIIGLLAFLYPFIVPVTWGSASSQTVHAADAPFLLSLLVGVCFVVLLLEVQGQAVSAKLVALLGVLIAINSLLRFLDVAIPVPGGLSPIFFLIILTGYVYGGRFGFLMGALTLLVSALLSGGVGPWLPYQMLTAGWIGLTAPLCRPFVQGIRAENQWVEVGVLAAFGAGWGLLYGIIMNIWFWPFVTGPAALYWEPGVGLAEVVQRYAAFYIATSLIWDLVRSSGNVLLMLLFGLPTLRILHRFRRRFDFTVAHPQPQSAD